MNVIVYSVLLTSRISALLYDGFEDIRRFGFKAAFNN